jgi:sigma-54-interacting transcriptional regulator
MTMSRAIGLRRIKAFEEDITLAAMSLAPVLITARPADALCIVRAIAERERRGRTREVLACDASAGDDVIGTIAGNRVRLATDRGTAILWIGEVHALTSRDQSALMRLLARPNSGREEGVPRIVASSSIALRDYVRKGRFDARLFYRLNIIHIVVPG